MDFETFMKGFETPPPNSIDMRSEPVQVLLYIKSKGYLEADIDFLNDYVQKHAPDHPDHWMVDSDCVGEIEDFAIVAKHMQEKEEDRIFEALNNKDHPDHEEEIRKL